jgi:hypothetical protein
MWQSNSGGGRCGPAGCLTSASAWGGSRPAHAHARNIISDKPIKTRMLQQVVGDRLPAETIHNAIVWSQRRRARLQT